LYNIPVLLTLTVKVNNIQYLVPVSVADPDPDPESSSFLTPGSGMGKKSGSGSGMNIEHPGSYFRELRNNFLG
jgi:hypothetical protein